MKIFGSVYFLVAITASLASGPIENDNEEVARSKVLQTSELLSHILSDLRDRDAIKSGAGVCHLWRGAIMRNICYFWDENGKPVEIKLSQHNVLTWLRRFADVPVPLLDSKDVFKSLDNVCWALSALGEEKPEAKQFFARLDRADIWRLTWPLQNQAIIFQNDPVLRVMHRRVLGNLFDMANIPQLYQISTQIFNSTLSQEDYTKLIVSIVQQFPEFAITSNRPFDPADRQRLFHAFCIAKERQIFLLQLLNRLNFAQLMQINAHIVVGKPWGEEQRQLYYCPIENQNSLFQYVIDEPNPGVFHVIMPHVEIDLDEYRTRHRVTSGQFQARLLFEVTVQNFEMLRPLCKFMSLRSLHRLLDKKTVQHLLGCEEFSAPGLQTLYELTKERYLRTGDSDDLKFIKMYETPKLPTSQEGNH